MRFVYVSTRYHYRGKRVPRDALLGITVNQRHKKQHRKVIEELSGANTRMIFKEINVRKSIRTEQKAFFCLTLVPLSLLIKIQSNIQSYEYRRSQQKTHQKSRRKFIAVRELWATISRRFRELFCDKKLFCYPPPETSITGE